MDVRMEVRDVRTPRLCSCVGSHCVGRPIGFRIGRWRLDLGLSDVAQPKLGFGGEEVDAWRFRRLAAAASFVRALLSFVTLSLVHTNYLSYPTSSMSAIVNGEHSRLYRYSS